MRDFLQLSACPAHYLDHGFHTEDSFWLAFALHTPVKTLDFFCPIPTSNEMPGDGASVATSDSDCKSCSSLSGEMGAAAAQPDTEDHKLNKYALQGSKITMGLHDMIHAAGPYGTQKSQEIFIQGLHGQQHISVDLSRDAVKPDCVTITMDIDSMIWVTPQPRFMTTINLHVTDNIVTKLPPMARSNRVTMEILWPQSDADRKQLGPRSEWFTQPVPISHLPHMQFSDCGLQRRYRTHIIFPRLWNELKTKLPHQLMKTFLNEVIIPCFCSCLGPGSDLYTHFTEDGFSQKAQLQTGAFSGITMLLAASKIPHLIQLMREIIQSHPHLSGFGSFFFVTDAHGIKLWTMSDMQGGHNPLEQLQMVVPDLDWPYMGQREVGELVLDVAVSYQPQGAIPLTGLWSLEKFKQSYSLGGCSLPEVHSILGLDGFGTMQARYPPNQGLASGYLL
ncbi:hypothetical protein FRB95_000693 [Tulasnella sp. JGI-2019a]|nr:hypothetical protein FRB95_000693 [Tulasnella sp. JGI-2019a]